MGSSEVESRRVLIVNYPCDRNFRWSKHYFLALKICIQWFKHVRAFLIKYISNEESKLASGVNRLFRTTY